VALNTASALISFYSKLEDQTEEFYNCLAENKHYVKGRDTFLAFAQENKKHKMMVTRTYREGITDAFEACFSFTGVHTAAYRIDTEISDSLSYTDALKKAITLEETAYTFCTHTSEKARALLAGIPQTFNWIAKKKASRKQRLEALLERE
jgi:rubrerythrin